MDTSGLYLVRQLDPNRSLGSSATSTLPLMASMTSHLRELAYTRRHPVEGRQTSAVHAHLTRPIASGSASAGSNLGRGGPGAANGANGHAASDSKTGDFMYYSDSDDEDFGLLDKDAVGDRMSCNFADCLSARQLGIPAVSGGRFYSQRLSSEYGTRHMLTNGMMKESAISVPQMNKIFCSRWLSDRQVVFGTKCNKVIND